MSNQDKRKQVQNLLSFMGLVAGVSNYEKDRELVVPEEEKIVVEPYDFFKNDECIDE